MDGGATGEASYIPTYAPAMKYRLTPFNLFSAFLVSGGILVLCCAGCRSRQVKQDEASNKTIYVDQFKLTYFRMLLGKAYNHSAAVQEMLLNDHSGFTEPILDDRDIRFIDSLTRADNERMRADSAQGALRAEGAQGKRPLAYMLRTLESKWLDSVAVRRFRNTR